ncbi:MAG: ferredoxin [Treponema sp.]|nr:ferredoxin [Treponema sp.]
MKLSVTLNGQKQILEAEPQTSLCQVLRDLGFTSVKNSGKNGLALSCTILLDGTPVPSDIIPFAIINNADIVTLEYFKTTEDYKDIENGFEQAGINLCGYCNSGMIFTAYDIIKTYQRPTIQEIEDNSSISYCCTSKKAFIAGVRSAIAFRTRRTGSFRNGHR